MYTRMKYAIIIAAVLVISSSSLAGAQTGTIKGKVKEYRGKALEGVVIRATSTKSKDAIHETKSDDKGDFEFSNVPPGDY